MFVARSELRGKLSILRCCSFLRTVKITKTQLDKLKQKYPGFPLTEFESYRLPWGKRPAFDFLHRVNLKFSLEVQWKADDWKLYPFYLWPVSNLGIMSAEIPKYQDLLSSTKEILNELTVKVITPTKLESVRKLLDLNVDKIKKLVKKNWWYC